MIKKTQKTKKPKKLYTQAQLSKNIFVFFF